MAGKQNNTHYVFSMYVLCMSDLKHTVTLEPLTSVPQHSAQVHLLLRLLRTWQLRLVAKSSMHCISNQQLKTRRPLQHRTAVVWSQRCSRCKIDSLRDCACVFYLICQIARQCVRIPLPRQTTRLNPCRSKLSFSAGCPKAQFLSWARRRLTKSCTPDWSPPQLPCGHA